MRAGRGWSSYGPPVRHRGDLLVVGYALVAQLEVHVWYPSLGLGPRLLLAGAVACLLARRRLPRLAPLACAVGGVVVDDLLPANHTGTGIVAIGVAAALLGRQGRPAVPAVAGLVVLTTVGTAVDLQQSSDLVTAPLVVLAVAVGSAVLYRASRQVEEVRARIADVEERSRHERAALLTGERRRVARELHDVVSHHLTVAALQASGARVQLASAGSRAAVVAALRAAEDAGRQALADLRPMLDVVGGEPGLAPRPGLADVPGLLDQVREAGLPVRATGLEHLRSVLPAGHDLVAYRVLQEAVTNAVRHGRGGIGVRLDVRDDALVLTVANDVAAGAPVGDDGHGLVGMRERLALYGGRLETSRRGGRWTLRAHLPLPAPVPA